MSSHFLTLLRIISGARYSGVPHRVHVLPFTLLANPKSVTYKWFMYACEEKLGYSRAIITAQPEFAFPCIC